MAGFTLSGWIIDQFGAAQIVLVAELRSIGSFLALECIASAEEGIGMVHLLAVFACVASRKW